MELPEVSPLPETNPLVNRFRFFNSKLTYSFFTKDHIAGLNSVLEYLRKNEAISSIFWRIPWVQDFLNTICFEIWIPAVQLNSSEMFSEEHFEAVMHSGRFAPQDLLGRLRLLSITLSRIEILARGYYQDDFTS